MGNVGGIDPVHPANRGILDYLARHNHKNAPISQTPDSVADPYFTLGSHPDVVEWLWDRIGRQWPENSRLVIYGSPGLVHPESGLVLAVALGTAYALRLVGSARTRAISGGAMVAYTYSTVKLVVDAEKEFGVDWVFGAWNGQESDWCLDTYLAIEEEFNRRNC